MSDQLSAAQRGRLAASLVPVALDLAVLVRHDGDAAAIGAFLGDLRAAERDALFVVLAAMVDIDQTPQELLSWVDFDEHGHPLPADAVMVIHDGNRQQPGTQRPRPDCGTPWGYESHRIHWEPICEPCRVAYNAYQLDKRRQRQQRTAESEAVA